MKSKKMSQRAYQVLAVLVSVGLLVVLGFSLNALFASRVQPSPQAVSQSEAQEQPPEVVEQPTSSPLNQTETAETPIAPESDSSDLDDYVFGKPEVVLTHDSAIGIAGWLPDSERLLITHEVPGSSHQTIETFNVRTGELQRYGERRALPSPPVWSAAQQAVVFTESTSEGDWVLRLGSGEKQPAKTLRSRLASFYVAADPTGQKVSVLTRDQGAQPAIIDLSGEPTRLLSARLSVEPWKTSPDAPLTWEQIYHVAWSPKGKQLAYFSTEGFFLADSTTGQVEQVDLGSSSYQGGELWALDAQWGPGGRYLAMLTTLGDLPAMFTELMILDTKTGRVRSEFQEPDGTAREYQITEITWGPKGQHLIILGQMKLQEGKSLEGLYLIDVLTGEFQRLLPSFSLIGAGYWGLDWSPDGGAIAVACPLWHEEKPLITEGRLCLIPVRKRR